MTWPTGASSAKENILTWNLLEREGNSTPSLGVSGWKTAWSGSSGFGQLRQNKNKYIGHKTTHTHHYILHQNQETQPLNVLYTLMLPPPLKRHPIRFIRGISFGATQVLSVGTCWPTLEWSSNQIGLFPFTDLLNWGFPFYSEVWPLTESLNGLLTERCSILRDAHFLCRFNSELTNPLWCPIVVWMFGPYSELPSSC